MILDTTQEASTQVEPVPVQLRQVRDVCTMTQTTYSNTSRHGNPRQKPVNHFEGDVYVGQTYDQPPQTSWAATCAQSHR